MGQQGLARPLSCGGHICCQLTAETARREQWVPLGSRERWWRVGPAASSQRGPPRASGSSQGLPPAPNAITVLSNGPTSACPGSSRAGGRRASASVCLRPGRRLAPRQEPQPPTSPLVSHYGTGRTRAEVIRMRGRLYGRGEPIVGGAGALRM